MRTLWWLTGQHEYGSQETGGHDGRRQEDIIAVDKIMGARR